MEVNALHSIKNTNFSAMDGTKPTETKTKSTENTGAAQDTTAHKPPLKTMPYYGKNQDLTSSNTVFSCVLRPIRMTATLRK